MFYLPSQEDLASWCKIKTLKYPLGLRNIEFYPNATKDIYLLQRFVEVEIGIAPERTQYLGNNNISNRNQYGPKHHVTSTIHAAI